MDYKFNVDDKVDVPSAGLKNGTIVEAKTIDNENVYDVTYYDAETMTNQTVSVPEASIQKLS